MIRCFSEGKDALERDKKGLGDFSKPHPNDKWYRERLDYWHEAKSAYDWLVGSIGASLLGLALTIGTGGLAAIFGGVFLGVGIAEVIENIKEFKSNMDKGKLWIGKDWITTYKYWCDRENDCRDYCDYLDPRKNQK